MRVHFVPWGHLQYLETFLVVTTESRELLLRSNEESPGMLVNIL
jgi:hypothetical protein